MTAIDALTVKVTVRTFKWALLLAAVGCRLGASRLPIGWLRVEDGKRNVIWLERGRV